MYSEAFRLIRTESFYNNLSCQIINDIFFQHEEYGNLESLLSSIDIEEIKKEYELVKAKKSNLPSAARNKVCQLHEVILKQGLQQSIQALY